MKVQRVLPLIGATICAVLLLVTTGCATGQPTDTPGVETMGEYVKKYTGDEMQVVVGYRYAANNPGEEWLILDTNLTAGFSEVVHVKREKVFLRTPAGDKIPLASQEDFSQAYGKLRPKLKQANIMRDPLDYFPPNREACMAGFFAIPGEGVVHDELIINDDHFCEGKLFFRVPGGVVAGRWVLGIDLQETRIRIPFEI